MLTSLNSLVWTSTQSNVYPDCRVVYKSGVLLTCFAAIAHIFHVSMCNRQLSGEWEEI